jgi:hypothetical protein
MGVLRLPCFSGVILQLVLLNPDAGIWKQVHAVGVVPVHVADDDVGDVLGLEAKRFQRVGGLDEIVDMPILEEAVVIETGVEKDVAAVAADEPDHHGEIEFAAGVGVGHEFGNIETGQRGVTNGIDLVLRFRLGGQGSKRERGDDHGQQNTNEAHEKLLRIWREQPFSHKNAYLAADAPVRGLEGRQDLPSRIGLVHSGLPNFGPVGRISPAILTNCEFRREPHERGRSPLHRLINQTCTKGHITPALAGSLLRESSRMKQHRETKVRGRWCRSVCQVEFQAHCRL